MSTDPKKYPAKKGTPSIEQSELGWVSPFRPDGSRKDEPEKVPAKRSLTVAPQMGKRSPKQVEKAAQARKDRQEAKNAPAPLVDGLSEAEQVLVPKAAEVEDRAINCNPAPPPVDTAPYVPPFQTLTVLHGDKGMLIDMETLMADVRGDIAEEERMEALTKETPEGSVTELTPVGRRETKTEKAARIAAEQQNDSLTAIERDFFKSTRKDPEPMITPTPKIEIPADVQEQYKEPTGPLTRFEANDKGEWVPAAIGATEGPAVHTQETEQQSDLAVAIENIILEQILADKKASAPEHDKAVEAFVEGDLKSSMVNNLDASKLDYTGPTEMNPRAAELVGVAEAGADVMSKHAEELDAMASKCRRATDCEAKISTIASTERVAFRRSKTDHSELVAHRNIMEQTIHLNMVVVSKVGPRVVAQAQPIEYKVVEEGRFGEVVPAPFLKLSYEEAQTLMDELWSSGVRPSARLNQNDQLATLTGHLNDMRAIVAKQLNVDLPKVR